MQLPRTPSVLLLLEVKSLPAPQIENNIRLLNCSMNEIQREREAVLRIDGLRISLNYGRKLSESGEENETRKDIKFYS
jgi:hypothetical protein